MTTGVVINRSSTRGSLGLYLEFLPSGIVWYTFLSCVERVFSYQTIPFLQRLCLKFNFFGWSYIYYLASPNFLQWIQIQHLELDTSRSDFQILRSCAVSPLCVYRPLRGIWCWQLFHFWRTSGDTTVWAGAVPPSGLDFLHSVQPINLQNKKFTLTDWLLR